MQDNLAGRNVSTAQAAARNAFLIKLDTDYPAPCMFCTQVFENNQALEDHLRYVYYYLTFSLFLLNCLWRDISFDIISGDGVETKNDGEGAFRKKKYAWGLKCQEKYQERVGEKNGGRGAAKT